MIYLDCNSTTPVSKDVADLVYKLMTEEFGNASSNTHSYGVNAKKYVTDARSAVAELANSNKNDVVFTSGATESNNIAILGLAEYARDSNKKHIITTKVEHKSVLEPIKHLEKKGFLVTYLEVNKFGEINLEELKSSLRGDTFLVSIMHVNNETGCISPLKQICELLSVHDAYFHVDAAQSFGKFNLGLENTRIDLMSVSGHKMYAPKGVGALITRKRKYVTPPLKPIIFGGDHEGRLRPGTVPSHLIAGFGLACKISLENQNSWISQASKIKESVLAGLKKFGAVINGKNTSPYTVNFSIPGVNSQAAILVLKDFVAISNGSACNSGKYEKSHVLVEMGLNNDVIESAIRMSWCHLTPKFSIDNLLNHLVKLI